MVKVYDLLVQSTRSFSLMYTIFKVGVSDVFAQSIRSVGISRWDSFKNHYRTESIRSRIVNPWLFLYDHRFFAISAMVLRSYTFTGRSFALILWLYSGVDRTFSHQNGIYLLGRIVHFNKIVNSTLIVPRSYQNGKSFIPGRKLPRS